MEDKKKKKAGRPVKYVYLDKFERANKDLEQRMTELNNIIAENQKKNARIQLSIVAILCVGLLIKLFIG